MLNELRNEHCRLFSGEKLFFFHEFPPSEFGLKNVHVTGLLYLTPKETQSAQIQAASRFPP